MQLVTSERIKRPCFAVPHFGNVMGLDMVNTLICAYGNSAQSRLKQLVASAKQKHGKVRNPITLFQHLFSPFMVGARAFHAFLMVQAFQPGMLPKNHTTAKCGAGLPIARHTPCQRMHWETALDVKAGWETRGLAGWPRP